MWRGEALARRRQIIWSTQQSRVEAAALFQRYVAARPKRGIRKGKPEHLQRIYGVSLGPVLGPSWEQPLCRQQRLEPTPLSGTQQNTFRVDASQQQQIFSRIGASQL